MTTTPNLGLALPVPNVDTGWGGTLNSDFTLIDNLFPSTGLGTSVGLNVGSGKTMTLGGTMVLGAGDNSGTVTPPTIRGAARVGTNVAGPDLTIDAANGAGTGGSGSIIFRTAPVGSSGSTPNTMRNVLQVKPDGTVTVLGVNIASAFFPGTVLDYAGLTASIPAGWLLCDGSSVATATYPALFAVLAYTYGGSGANFNLPDGRGRVTAGRDDMGGTAANRLTTAGSGINGVNLGAAGGLEYHQLTIGQMPSHQHFMANTDSPASGTVTGSQYVTVTANNSYYAYTLAGTSKLPTLGLTGLTGGDGNHNNTQPTLVVNKIIKT